MKNEISKVEEEFIKSSVLNTRDLFNQLLKITYRLEEELAEAKKLNDINNPRGLLINLFKYLYPKGNFKHQEKMIDKYLDNL
jgi:hypothetical protein